MAFGLAGVPAGPGGWDEAISVRREVWRGRSVRSTRNEGGGERGGCSKCSFAELVVGRLGIGFGGTESSEKS